MSYARNGEGSLSGIAREKTCLIDAFGPIPVLEPADPAELGEVVRQADARGAALYPLGGQTAPDLGLPPTRLGLALGLQRLDKIIDYPARDMTITVQAGLRVAELQRLLAGENQRLPVDVPQAERATLGGILASNPSGPRRYGYGTLRDYVIGISVVNDAGEEVKAGGRVVKNVAGYDLCKLHVGSLGTLGIITQVTLKLRPRVEEMALILVPTSEGELENLLDQLHGSQTRPVMLDLLNPAAVKPLNATPEVKLPEGGWVVIVGLEGSRAALQWQVQQLVKELGRTYALEARVAEPAEPLARALVEFARCEPAVLTFQAALLPSETAAFVRQASVLGEGIMLQAHAGNGIVIGHVPADLTRESAGPMLKRLRELTGGGHVVVRRCPAAWKDAAFVWGPPRGDVWLMRKIKEQLDPRGLFNPGRFVDAI
jgi:glycolate oxidase FAD binding subunit